MPRRQILSSEEKERLLVVPDDDVLLTRMCFLSEHDLAIINKHRRPENRLGLAVLLCYLRGPGVSPDKNSSPHRGVISRLAAHLKLQPDLWAEYASREVTRGSIWLNSTATWNYPHSPGTAKNMHSSPLPLRHADRQRFFACGRNAFLAPEQ